MGSLKGVKRVRYVLAVLRRKDAEQQLPVVRMEIDYELLTLHDAMLANDSVQIIKSKEKLNQLRLELLKIIEISKE